MLHADLSNRVTERLHQAQNPVGHNVLAPSKELEQSAYQDSESPVVTNFEGRSNASNFATSQAEGGIDYSNPSSFDISIFTDDAAYWPDFLQLLDLESPMASYGHSVP